MNSKASSQNPVARGKDALRGELLLLKVAKRLEQLTGTRFHASHRSSLSRFDVLANLDQSSSGSLSTSELAARLIASKGNITRLLDRMEQDDLVRRSENPDDRRISDISLTPFGREKFRHMAADHERWMAEVFDVLDDAEAVQLIGLLGKLRYRIDNLLAP